MGIGEYARLTSIFSFSNSAFFPLLKTDFKFWVVFNLSSANVFILDKSKILLFGKELTNQNLACVIVSNLNLTA